MDIVIIDVDNCISDDCWRRDHIIPSDVAAAPEVRWHAYHLAAGADEARNIHIFKQIPAGSRIVISTAMPEFYRRRRERWLRKHNVPFDQLVMRANKDHRPSVEVKRDALHAIIREYPHANIMAYDDHPEIVTMYKNHGVFAIHMAINEDGH